VTGPSGMTVSHTFTEADAYDVGVTATDHEGAEGDVVSRVVTIQTATGGAGSAAMVGNDLVVYGTNADDVIKFTERNRCGSGADDVYVRINGHRFGPFRPTGRIIAYGLDGNDRITVSDRITLPSTLDGGNGNDRLQGGGGSDLLLGGAGCDRLTAHKGNDTLRGGDGTDVLDGGAGNDVLRAGTGNDVLLGGDGNDDLRGGTGNDVLFGGAGCDELSGGAGTTCSSAGPATTSWTAARGATSSSAASAPTTCTGTRTTTSWSPGG